MIEIVKSSEFNARAVKTIDIENKIPGYNFSYPVLNTIDICNILMLGGSIEITIERMGKSTWCYNIEAKELLIEKPTSTEKHMIIDTTELISEMDKYFNMNKEELWEKNYKTNIKKSISKRGNKNAQKAETSNSKKISNQNIEVKDNDTQKDLSTPPVFQNRDCELDDYGDPIKCCSFDEYHNKYGKSLLDYFNWLKRTKRLYCLNPNMRQRMEELGIDIDKECLDEFYRQNGGRGL